jgi:hypothetical protein
MKCTLLFAKHSSGIPGGCICERGIYCASKRRWKCDDRGRVSIFLRHQSLDEINVIVLFLLLKHPSEGQNRYNNAGLVGLLNPPTRKSRFRPIRGQIRICGIPNCFLAWSEFALPRRIESWGKIKLFGDTDFSESFSSHFRNHKAPALGLKIRSVLGYEPWGSNTSLDAVNQHPRATDSAIGFGGSQIYSSQQYVAPQVHMDMALHTDSLAKFFPLPDYDNSREH